MPLIQQDEVEHSDAPLDVFDFVFAAIANVLAVDLAIQTAGEQVIDRSAFWKAFGPGVALGLEFVPEEWSCACPNGRR